MGIVLIKPSPTLTSFKSSSNLLSSLSSLPSNNKNNDNNLKRLQLQPVVARVIQEIIPAKTVRFVTSRQTVTNSESKIRNSLQNDSKTSM